MDQNACRADLYSAKLRLEKLEKQVHTEAAKALSQSKLAAHFQKQVKEKEAELREELENCESVRE